MTHTIRIDGFHPARLNELLGDWRRAARRKKTDRQAVALAARLAGTPRATGKRRVLLTLIMGPRQRCPDVDAFWKSTLDSLVKCGQLTDDNKEGCELAPVQYQRGPKKATIITLEDMEQA